MAAPRKFPIAWHEQCLANCRENFQRELEALRRKELDVDRMSRDIFHREAQIAEAKKLGLDGFDPERFMKAKP